MTGLLAGRVQFFPVGLGGRVAGPPAGPLYFPNLAPASADHDDALRSDRYFSARVQLDGTAVEGWTFAKVEALVPGGPGDELLVPGAAFHLMQGPRIVGRLELDAE